MGKTSYSPQSKCYKVKFTHHKIEFFMLNNYNKINFLHNVCPICLEGGEGFFFRSKRTMAILKTMTFSYELIGIHFLNRTFHFFNE